MGEDCFLGAIATPVSLDRCCYAANDSHDYFQHTSTNLLLYNLVLAQNWSIHSVYHSCTISTANLGSSPSKNWQAFYRDADQCFDFNWSSHWLWLDQVTLKLLMAPGERWRFCQIMLITALLEVVLPNNDWTTKGLRPWEQISVYQLSCSFGQTSLGPLDGEQEFTCIDRVSDWSKIVPSCLSSSFRPPGRAFSFDQSYIPKLEITGDVHQSRSSIDSKSILFNFESEDDSPISDLVERSDPCCPLTAAISSLQQP